jgi:hypothetical protein
MAAVAREHGIAVEPASFEAWDAAGRGFDLITSGQAWHWVDPDIGAESVVRGGGGLSRPPGSSALERAGFAAVIHRTFAWTQDYTSAEWTELIFTHSDHAALPAGQRRVLASEIATVLDGSLSVSYSTQAIFARTP